MADTSSPVPHPPPTLRWLAEWEPHAATWIAWPHNQEDWPGKFGPIPWVYCDIVKHLSRAERVCILVQDAASEQEAAAMLQRTGVDGHQIRFFQTATDRVWTRDYGPTFVLENDRLVAVKWQFNAWAKYDNWQNDEAAGQRIAGFSEAEMRRVRFRQKPVFLEGGSIDGNGAATLLTTEECLLSTVQSRNPGLTTHDLERVFADALGIRKVLWLNRGITGDDTHGHVDDLARFVNRNTVVAVSEDDPGDFNHEPLCENLDRLRGMTTADGEPLKVVTLPLPHPLAFDGQRLPASYANFYIANGLILAPTFADARDREALNTLAELFPARQIVGIPCGDLVWGLGTIHCLTQQQPAEARHQ